MDLSPLTETLPARPAWLRGVQGGRAPKGRPRGRIWLAAAAVAMPSLARASPMRAIMWAATAGFPVGLAAGFKLTMAVYCVAFVLAALVVPRRWPERMAVAGAGGGGIGALVASGPWFAIMWAKTGNPIFPFLNQVFQSPLAMVESYRDASGVPDSL